MNSQQGYQLTADILDGCVHQSEVELLLGSKFFTGGGETAFDHLRRLGSPADETAYELFPGRRGQEDESRLPHGRAHLAGALQVDLQKCRHAGGEVLEHRTPRRTVTI